MNKYGLTEEELKLADKIASIIVNNIQEKGIDFNAVLAKMKQVNESLEQDAQKSEEAA